MLRKSGQKQRRPASNGNLHVFHSRWRSAWIAAVCVILLLAVGRFVVHDPNESSASSYQAPTPTRSRDFSLFVLGAGGGPVDARVSGFALLPPNSASDLICFDCGTLRHSLHGVAKYFGSSSRHVHQNMIAAYLVSHAHLDHISGMVIASADERSPDKGPKPIVGLNETLSALHMHIFNNQVWPDMPGFGFFFYQELEPRLVVQHLGRAQGGLNVIAFPVSHGKSYLSTCFLLGYNLSDFSLHEGDAILLCGDLGSDSNEGTNLNEDMWSALAPLIINHRLKTILIECSFPSETPSHLLFGHLTPILLLEELHVLASKVRSSLAGLRIIVQHIKESDLDDVTGRSATVDAIKIELMRLNNLKVDILFAHEFIGNKIDL
ncbi:cAMP phosphodiesterases class-II-domain-containing protein [Chytriomyces sp. MP71]|nr:cAMP phosphodiesterases class-II-domain-containing protein [Chytriomyces sp. MP71]